mmetsp:Transcript_10078/g.19916  ORF Transcript_10078/g.19916 Transcript_10078/m.19916 type:complete len:125 (+) Transcript_10078:573-947(+)
METPTGQRLVGSWVGWSEVPTESQLVVASEVVMAQERARELVWGSGLERASALAFVWALLSAQASGLQWGVVWVLARGRAMALGWEIAWGRLWSALATEQRWAAPKAGLLGTGLERATAQELEY